MNLKTLRPILLGASILVLGAGGASAQPAPPPGPDAMAGVHHDGRGMRHERRDPVEMARRHADHLRAALQLTPAQEPALAAFIGAMKPPEGMRDHMRGDHEKMASMTTPQRLDQMKDRMDEHRARFEQHAAAVKRFYAQLTPAQQKAFDTLPMGHMGHGGHGMHGPMGHGMEHGQRG